MQVEIIAATQNPVDVISIAAGVCYGKDDVSPKRVRHCFKAGHMSVFEHASATFKVSGISRACMAQLTRHRLASFCVESQRYCRYDLNGGEWYVVPPEFEEQGFVGDHTKESWFRKMMYEDAARYMRALEEGVKPEDARFLLPEAAKTRMVVTMNARELFHVADMRESRSAQWEVRGLVGQMLDALREESPQWAELVDMQRGGCDAGA